MNKHTPILTPRLDHDASMLERFNTVVGTNGRIERRIVANLIAHMQANGFVVHSVYDGEEETLIKYLKNGDAIKAAMEIIFNLSECSLRISRADQIEKWHGIWIILGNGEDCIADWNYFADDRDGFNAAMEAFDASEYA